MKWTDNCKNDVNSLCDYDYDGGNCERDRERECANASECERTRDSLALSASALPTSEADGANGSRRKREREREREKGAGDTSRTDSLCAVALLALYRREIIGCNWFALTMHALSTTPSIIYFYLVSVHSLDRRVRRAAPHGESEATRRKQNADEGRHVF